MNTVHTRRLTTIGVMTFFAGTFALSWVANRTREFAASETTGVYLGSVDVVLQDKDNNCGAAALKMILDHYGIRATLREIERQMRLTRGGSSMLAMKEVAKSYGVRADGWSLSREDLARKSLPSIIFIESHHYVVVDGVDDAGWLFVRDPAIGRMKIPPEKLAKIWGGEALIFTHGVIPRD
jgi:ABC-type bacteriocin/lantibiotic exporter with double-glycine peptidase domain